MDPVKLRRIFADDFPVCWTIFLGALSMIECLNKNENPIEIIWNYLQSRSTLFDECQEFLTLASILKSTKEAPRCVLLSYSVRPESSELPEHFLKMRSWISLWTFANGKRSLKLERFQLEIENNLSNLKQIGSFSLSPAALSTTSFEVQNLSSFSLSISIL